MIVFSSVTKKFADRAVIDRVTFTVQPGEFVCLTGPSGAGKSTIVHLLIRAEVPTEGTIEVDGADLALLPRSILQMYRRKTGVLFQDYKLLSDRTVAENIAFALEVSDVPDSEIAERVEELLTRLRLTDRRSAFPSELSGGEKTRTALARALASRPTILIADEPTGNIDPDQSMEILALLKQVNAEGATVILASHDQRVVDSLNVRVLRLEQGAIVRDSVGGYNTTAAPLPVPVELAKTPDAVSPEGAVHPHHIKAHSRDRHGKPHHAVHHPRHKDDDEPTSHTTGKIKPIGI